MDKSKIPPTKKQIDTCMMILERIGSCPCSEDGEPCFEESMEAADTFIKQNPYQRHRGEDVTGGEWGNIPNH
jgi:hypothetical protein